MGRRRTSSAIRPAAVAPQPPAPRDPGVERGEGSLRTTAGHSLRRAPHRGGRSGALEPALPLLCLPNSTRLECLEQILHAFGDIADRDDIHQAAERLEFVQQWIKLEAERAAADPIFVALRLV
jgi:hypothetical protein